MMTISQYDRRFDTWAAHETRYISEFSISSPLPFSHSRGDPFQLKLDKARLWHKANYSQAVLELEIVEVILRIGGRANSRRLQR
ncbi:hypothetical protein Nepgr_005704 [Nepenthes gracilis]|uniref:Uncharacterized protein n=1 Tax=Nepenthes gracilis TaxID=150966 RepID=A0AAD3S3N2_NEPGR|nr:hypothetical protein Nepgr_005704 [Nepenthes gracilis]